MNIRISSSFNKPWGRQSPSSSKPARRTLERIRSTPEQIRKMPNATYLAYLKDLSYFLRSSLGLDNKKFVAIAPMFREEAYKIFALFSLVKKYDAVVAVAHQGLRYAALAEMAGVPLYVVEAHGHDGVKSHRWIKKPSPDKVVGKRVLVLEDDVLTGNTLDTFVGEISQNKPLKLDLILTNYKGASNQKARVLDRFDSLFFLEDISGMVDYDQLDLFITRAFACNVLFKNKVLGIDRQLTKLTVQLKATKVIGKYRRARLRRAVYRNLYEIISPKIEDPAVKEEAEAKVEILKGILDELASRCAQSRKFPLDDKYIASLFYHLENSLRDENREDILPKIQEAAVAEKPPVPAKKDLSRQPWWDFIPTPAKLPSDQFQIPEITIESYLNFAGVLEKEPSSGIEKIDSVMMYRTNSGCIFL